MNKLTFLTPFLLAACTTELKEFDRVDEVGTANDLDILYVLDTSADRANYDTMAGQLDVLSTQLASVDGQVPNLHVGVVTADLGITGTEDEASPATFRNCAGTGDGGKLTVFDAALPVPYLEDLRGENGTRVRNFEGDEDADLAAELALLVNPTISKTGCEVIQPMEAMRRALDPANNPGFLRDRAQLMVVFLTSEDDCSLKTGSFLGAGQPNAARCATEGVICVNNPDPGRPGTHTTCRPREDSDKVIPVSEYVTFLTDLKGDASNVVVNAIAGPKDAPYVTVDLGATGLLIADVCNGPGGGHKPATRINSLVSAFDGASANGCTQDAVYEQLTAPVVDRARSCFPALKASDGDNCRVIERVNGEETELAPCGSGGEAACYTLYTDADACPRGENIGISIDRRSSTAPATSTIEATCFVK